MADEKTISSIMGDPDFLSASPEDQTKYVASIDSDFAKGSKEEQTAYISQLPVKMYDYYGDKEDKEVPLGQLKEFRKQGWRPRAEEGKNIDINGNSQDEKLVKQNEDTMKAVTSPKNAAISGALIPLEGLSASLFGPEEEEAGQLIPEVKEAAKRIAPRIRAGVTEGENEYVEPIIKNVKRYAEAADPIAGKILGNVKKEVLDYVSPSKILENFKDKPIKTALKYLIPGGSIYEALK